MTSIAVVIPNYNSARTVARSARAMLEQDLPSGVRRRVVVVDDGSTDGSAQVLQDSLGDEIILVRLARNTGRSTARNAGAEAAGCEVLVFVDSDCVPPRRDFLAWHLHTLEHGADVVFGDVLTPGAGFWDQLQRDASAWRKRRFDAGERWVYTTQNVAVRAEMFAKAGRFDPAFDRHGFEDRDLFVRLADAGARVAFSEKAAVVHEDVISLCNVFRKLTEAGYYAAGQFNKKHPAVYRAMSFSRLDAGNRAWMRWLDPVTWPLARWVAGRNERWLEATRIPFRLRALAARLVYGAGFLHGTVLQATGRPFVATTEGAPRAPSIR
jgi:glycosyltransferase involved in cell wall biosynthesis